MYTSIIIAFVHKQDQGEPDVEGSINGEQSTCKHTEEFPL